MSHDKAITSGKEKRTPYRRGKAVDSRCCNHGSCAWCEGNRTHTVRKAFEGTEGQEDEFFGYWFYPDPSDVTMDLYDEQIEKFGIDIVRAEREFNDKHRESNLMKKQPPEVWAGVEELIRDIESKIAVKHDTHTFAEGISHAAAMKEWEDVVKQLKDIVSDNK